MLSSQFNSHSYFFDQGIHFTCKKCGNCCCGEPGIVRVTLADIDKIAEYTSKSPQEILTSCVYPYEKDYSIRERKDGCCLFYEDGCQIYPVRPVQCRTYPFWFRNMRSEKNWIKVCQECPGVNQGRHYTKDQILSILNQTM